MHSLIRRAMRAPFVISATFLFFKQFRGSFQFLNIMVSKFQKNVLEFFDTLIADLRLYILGLDKTLTTYSADRNRFPVPAHNLFSAHGSLRSRCIVESVLHSPHKTKLLVSTTF